MVVTEIAVAEIAVFGAVAASGTVLGVLGETDTLGADADRAAVGGAGAALGITLDHGGGGGAIGASGEVLDEGTVLAFPEVVQLTDTAETDELLAFDETAGGRRIAGLDAGALAVVRDGVGLAGVAAAALAQELRAAKAVAELGVGWGSAVGVVGVEELGTGTGGIAGEGVAGLIQARVGVARDGARSVQSRRDAHADAGALMVEPAARTVLAVVTHALGVGGQRVGALQGVVEVGDIRSVDTRSGAAGRGDAASGISANRDTGGTFLEAGLVNTAAGAGAILRRTEGTGDTRGAVGTPDAGTVAGDGLGALTGAVAEARGARTSGEPAGAASGTEIGFAGASSETVLGDRLAGLFEASVVVGRERVGVASSGDVRDRASAIGARLGIAGGGEATELAGLEGTGARVATERSAVSAAALVARNRLTSTDVALLDRQSSLATGALILVGKHASCAAAFAQVAERGRDGGAAALTRVSAVRAGTAAANALLAIHEGKGAATAAADCDVAARSQSRGGGGYAFVLVLARTGIARQPGQGGARTRGSAPRLIRVSAGAALADTSIALLAGGGNAIGGLGATAAIHVHITAGARRVLGGAVADALETRRPSESSGAARARRQARLIAVVGVDTRAA